MKKTSQRTAARTAAAAKKKQEEAKKVAKQEAEMAAELRREKRERIRIRGWGKDGKPSRQNNTSTTDIIPSFLSGIADFVSNSVVGVAQRASARWNNMLQDPSLYNIVNYATLGTIGNVHGVLQRSSDKWNNMLQDPSLYNIVDYASIGTVNNVDRVVSSEPFSEENWAASVELFGRFAAVYAFADAAITANAGNAAYGRSANIMDDAAQTIDDFADDAVKTLDEGAGGTGDKLVNLASPTRTNHILYGDKTGGGHLWPGQSGKSVFPESWNAEKVMHNVSDIVTDPTLTWQKGRLVNGVQRYEVLGIRNGVQIKTITDGIDIITAYPLK